MTRLVALHAGGTREPWQSIGLIFDDHSCQVSDIHLVIEPGEPQLTSWTFTGATDAIVDVDGIETRVITHSDTLSQRSTIGSQTVVGLDHVVVTTDNLDRTCGAIEEVLQLPMRRERDAGNGVTQRFHKLENTIIEVVTGPHVKHSGAQLWGFVLSVDDLFDLAESLGESITSPPKRAVQQGRYISTIRGSVGLGVPVALMTPHIA